MGSAIGESPGLAYFISQKSDTVIISFSGTMTRNENAPLKTCVEEAVKSGAIYFILNLDGIDKIDRGALPVLGKLIRHARTVGWLQLCSIKVPVLEFMNREGMLRGSDTSRDLPEALQKRVAVIGVRSAA